MTYPDKQNTLALMGDWANHHAAVSKLMDDVESSMGLNPNGPLFEVVWKLFDAYTNTLSAEIGDHGNWLEWFSSENDMGEAGREAGYDEKVRPIKTLQHLYSLISESRKRTV